MSNQLALKFSTYYSTVYVTRDVITRYVIISLTTHTVTHLLLLLCCLLFFSFRHNTVDFTLLPDHDVVLTLFLPLSLF